MAKTSRTILNGYIGGSHVKLEVFGNDLCLHDYGILRQSWFRGIKLMKQFGAEPALELIDHRAYRAADRGDYDTSRKWRELITAIHAAVEDEHLPGERTH